MGLKDVIKQEYKEGFYIHPDDCDKVIFLFFCENNKLQLEKSVDVGKLNKEKFNKYEYVKYPYHYSKTNQGKGAKFIRGKILNFSNYEIIKFLDYEFY